MAIEDVPKKASPFIPSGIDEIVKKVKHIEALVKEETFDFRNLLATLLFLAKAKIYLNEYIFES